MRDSMGRAPDARREPLATIRPRAPRRGDETATKPRPRGEPEGARAGAHPPGVCVPAVTSRTFGVPSTGADVDSAPALSTLMRVS